MDRERPKLRRNQLVPTTDSEWLGERQPLPATPLREVTPPPEADFASPAISHNFARVSVLPVAERAESEVLQGEVSPWGAPAGTADLAPVAPGAGLGAGLAVQRSVWREASATAGYTSDGLLAVQRDGEPGAETPPPPPPELQLIDPTVIRPGLSQINLGVPLTLTPPSVAPPEAAGATPAALPPMPNLTLNQPTIGGPQPAPAFGPGSPPMLTPPGPLVPAGAGPAAPRSASIGDMMGAIMAVPTIDWAIVNLKMTAQQKILGDWKKLNTGEAIGTISTLGVIGLGAIGGALANADSRNFLLGQISGKVLPIPGVPWLSVEFTAAGDNLGFGLHLDVGKLLPPKLGFGGSSASPLGGPPVQREAAEGASDAGMPVAEGIRAAAGGGRPLEGATRERLEAGLGANLGAVRVHADAQADGLARGVQANAFTSGRDIFFREGTYNPGSQEGMRLLAHETTHVLQQSAGPVAGTPGPGGVAVSRPGDPFEREAESVAATFVQREADESAGRRRDKKKV